MAALFASIVRYLTMTQLTCILALSAGSSISALIGMMCGNIVLDMPYRPVYSMLEKNKTVTKFLNRMLAMSLRDQKLLFAYFSDTLVRLLAAVRPASSLVLIACTCNFSMVQKQEKAPMLLTRVHYNCGHIQNFGTHCSACRTLRLDSKQGVLERTDLCLQWHVMV